MAKGNDSGKTGSGRKSKRIEGNGSISQISNTHYARSEQVENINNTALKWKVVGFIWVGTFWSWTTANYMYEVYFKSC